MAAINQLSFVAVLLDFVVLEETRYEPRPLTASIERIEENPHYGLYNVLCHLHVIHTVSSTSSRNDVVVTPPRVTLTTIRRASFRHLRVYSILHDFSSIVLHLADEFSYMLN